MYFCSNNEQIFNIYPWSNFYSFNTLSLVVTYRWTKLDQVRHYGQHRYTISDKPCI